MSPFHSDSFAADFLPGEPLVAVVEGHLPDQSVADRLFALKFIQSKKGEGRGKY
jgi:hypothetical protein